MAVNVRFADGTEKQYPTADSASNRFPVFVVSRWNSKRRIPEEVAVFESDQVALAEVIKGHSVTQIVLGAGKRQPS